MANANVQRDGLGVLVVDDDEEFCALIKLTVKNLGYTKVMSANSALSALKKIEAGIVDLVLCDRNMPGISGVDLLANVRKYNDFQDLPFIFLTSEKDKNKVVEAIRAGATDYILKTSSHSDLSRSIDRILESHIQQKNSQV